MPFVFAIAGALLIVSGVRGTTSQLSKLVVSDFTGQPNYFEWMVAIFLIGAIGYVKQLQTISRMFMVLVLMGLLWQHKGVFAQFTAQETQQPISPTATSNGLPALPSLQSPSNNFSELPNNQILDTLTGEITGGKL